MITYRQFERWKEILLTAEETDSGTASFAGGCAMAYLMSKADYQEVFTALTNKGLKAVFRLNDSAPNHAARVLRVIEYLESQVDPAAIPTEEETYEPVAATVRDLQAVAN